LRCYIARMVAEKEAACQKTWHATTCKSIEWKLLLKKLTRYNAISARGAHPNQPILLLNGESEQHYIAIGQQCIKQLLLCYL
jgi:hypothetical protein